MTVNGTAKIDITGIKAQVGIDLASQASATGGQALALKSRTVDLVISQDNISVDLEGDGVAAIASLLKPIIKSLISN